MPPYVRTGFWATLWYMYHEYHWMFFFVRFILQRREQSNFCKITSKKIYILYVQEVLSTFDNKLPHTNGQDLLDTHYRVCFPIWRDECFFDRFCRGLTKKKTLKIVKPKKISYNNNIEILNSNTIVKRGPMQGSLSSNQYATV